jgi:hypothetical protein
MTHRSPAFASSLCRLADDEATTLGRIAFGQSGIRSLRREDIARLRALALIVEGRNEISLAISGRKHFESLPCSIFAAKAHPGNGWQA